MALRLIALMTLLQGQVLSLTIITPRSHVTHDVGGNVTFLCTVTGEKFNYFYNPIIWYKVLEDGTDIQINNGGVLNDPFGSTGRYNVVPEMKGDGRDGKEAEVLMTMTISDLKLGDNGTFRCDLRDKQAIVGSVTHELIIPAAIDELVLETNKSRLLNNATKLVYEFDEFAATYVSCRSRGGNPEPQVRMYRGKTDITGEFFTEVRENRAGPKGLETISYEIEVVKPDFRADSEHSGQRLKCVARIHHLPQLKKTIVGIMDVKFPPRYECQNNIYAWPDSKNFSFDCKITGNPPVRTSDVYWEIDGLNATNLTVGEYRDGVASNATVDEEDSSITVTMTIAEVNMTHYQTYKLRARNSVGERHFQIHLAQATTTTSTTTTTQKPVVVDKNDGYDVVNDKEPNRPASVQGDSNGGGRCIAQCPVAALITVLLSLWITSAIPLR